MADPQFSNPLNNSKYSYATSAQDKENNTSEKRSPQTTVRNNDEVVNGSTIFNRLPVIFSDPFRDGDTKPIVENITVWICKNTAATVITNFLKGSPNQPITILGDANTTIANNANIKTNTGANKALAANRIYRFTFIENVWYED